ncbi:polysaccharide deacetylase family protein [Paenibacillus kobensis]|uniref:polysaccharide deacetylase family protein n=1 Tax=Paenibacillus kobensis TaxID=59841 RepID=UPI000FDB40E0|nr:polysaccharide deacetylase family protein [Paenibacillus kobensis]
MQNLLILLFYGLTFYAFLPGLISRLFGFRVFKRGRAKREIALTFDDGPDPRYTPQLLDLLQRYGAKATFFVVGAHAERHPELLKRMQDEGHVIGVHNYEHKTNWLMRPKTVKRQIERTNEIIMNATGQRAVYYRPPWGIVNIFDYSLRNLQIILWSSLFGDWRYKVGAKQLEQRMMKKLRPGEVMLLHDCGMTPGADENAPENMLKALDNVMREGVRRGFRFIAIDEMIGLTEKARALVPKRSKRIMIGLWLTWEKLFHLTFRTKPIGSPDPSFHYRVIKYHGRTLSLSGGRELVNGDPIVELHFDNKLLMELAHKSASPVATAIRLVREMEKRLPIMAMTIAEDAEARRAKAVYGVTMIHRGADRMGFQVHPLPDGLFARMSKIYLHILMRILTPPSKPGKKSERHAVEMAPHIVLFDMPDILNLAAAAHGEGGESFKHAPGTRRTNERLIQPLPNRMELNEELEGAAVGKSGL